MKIISSETGYGIIADGNKVYVNGGSDESLGTPVLVLHVCMFEGRDLKSGYTLDFVYVSSDHSADILN